MEVGDRPAVEPEAVDAPLVAEGVQHPAGFSDRLVEGRFGHLDESKNEHRVEYQVAQVDFLADHLLMDLALGGYIDHEVPADLGGTAEPPVSGEGPSPPVVVLDGSPGGDVVGSDRYAVLGELAERGLDLAPAAYSPTATYRVEVDPELPGGVQHRGARGEAPPVA